MVERFPRLNYGTLQIDVTIDDPKAYTRPFTVRFTQRLTPNTELIKFICNENERSVQHMVPNDQSVGSRQSAVSSRQSAVKNGQRVHPTRRRCGPFVQAWESRSFAGR